jgi:NADP-dependent 3-hydroxy acid dehydrogenase YdfG
MLLRGGATVIATTSSGSALRFLRRRFHGWGHRLKIHGLDLTHSVNFLQFYRAKYEVLDILINNAAQTVETTSGILYHLIMKRRGSDKFVTKTGTGVCWTTRIVCRN